MKDYVTVLGYWYHKCPVTGERRIGHDYRIPGRGGVAYQFCAHCGASRPAPTKEKDK